MGLINPHHITQEKTPLKKSKMGMEMEFFVLDDQGKMSSHGPKVIDALARRGVPIIKEIGKNMVEFGCFPGVEAFNPSFNIVESLHKTLEYCEKNNLVIFPFATYPGSFTPQISKGVRYSLQEKVFGKELISISCRIAGFHHHYTLPKSVFDHKKKMLRVLHKGKLSRSLIASYNFEIAADPVLTLLTQSSPFYEGMNLAKDSRVLAYRGGRKLGYMAGLYAKNQQLGGLPPYKQTVTDLLTSLQKRWQRFETEARKVAPHVNMNKLYPYKLDITWNPVKINKLGTLEQRGMDVNYPSITIAVAVLLKFCLRNIQRHFIEVIPADFGTDEAFKVENGILYVPPHTVVRDQLQPLSAYDGYANDVLLNYTKRFFSFAQGCTPRRYAPIIAPLKEMLEEKKSMSDKIVAYAHLKGYIQENGAISNSDAADLSLHYAGKLSRDVTETMSKLEKMRVV